MRPAWQRAGKRLAAAAAGIAAMCAAPAAAQAGDAGWQAKLAERRAALIAGNGPGTDAALRAQLLAMRDQDQQARGLTRAATAGSAAGPVQIATNLAEIDAALTAQLKVIVESKGWPTIALVGLEASNAAMLLLTHTPDHAWQVSLLPKLEDLADAGRIDGASLAFVIDKELVAEGKLQRYGTQFKLLDGAMAMYGAEDPGGLDRERAQVMLPPIEEYQRQLSAMYHLPVSRKIASAAK